MMHRCMNTFLWSCKLILLSLILVLGISARALAQYFPIHATVQWPAPQSPYLADYSTAGRDRLIVTLLNRDQQQPLLFAKLRLQLKSGGFTAKNREEVAYPMLELNTGVPFRLTGIDLAPYLQPQNLQSSGNLRNGQLPTGYAELSVQVVEYYTGRPLSDWHTARAYLDVKKPPFLNLPEQDAQVALRDPLFIRFQWTPRHQGLSGTEYEFVLKELPDNGVAPQSAFAYGQEIYRTHTRSTSLSYTHLDPLLLPNRRYAWQVRALAREGVNEVGMFEHGGYSEISWFTLNDRCDAPRGLKAQPRFAKVDLSWSKVLGTTGYVVECRPKTKLNVYEWAQTEAAGEQLTLARLKPGWTYEWRVGTRCTGDRPVFSEVREFTLSKYDENLLAACGKEPVRSDLVREPHLDIRAGDVVTIGGDYPMTITEVTPLGDGWYAGKGKTRLKTIIDAPIALRFDRLRINVDKYQIDGTVEAAYDEGKGEIANTDYVDDGGKDLRPATLRIREQKLGYSLPESPRFLLKTPKFFQEGGNFLVETQDADGHPQTIQLELQEGADYKSVFPMTVTDAEGNSYRIQPEESGSQDDDTSTSQGQIALTAERVAQVGDFNADVLSKKYGQVRFERGPGKYAFDDGKEKWYQKSVKLDRFYKPFAKDYIAPWKLIPEGETDVVTAHYEGKQRIDVSKLVFTSDAKSPALPSSYDETSGMWSIKLPSVASGSTYDVFAVYEGEVLGKLHVVSYAKQRHKVTLVPINDAKLDKTHIERELNAVYTPVGVHFDVAVDERMRGDYSWEVPGEEDKQLSLVGKSFWGYDKELKESTEMLQLQQAYQAKAGTLEGAYLFVLDGAKGLSSGTAFLQGEMPRKSRFGYLFSNDGEELSKTIAHELGHGLFTLRHTFDSEYAGKKSQDNSSNLMDYAEGTSLAAFQWNVMASPAIFTAADKAEEVAFGGGIAISPDLKFIYIPGAEIISNFYDEAWRDSLVVGTLPSFELNKSTYRWNGEGYAKVSSSDSTVYKYNVSDVGHLPIYLFYNLDKGCGYTSVIEVPKSYVNELKGIIEAKSKSFADKERELFKFVYKLAPQHSQRIPCLKDIAQQSPDAKILLDCGSSGNLVRILQPALDEVNKITSFHSAAQINKILEDNYSPCLFAHIALDKRLAILKNLFSEDDRHWEFSNKYSFGDSFFLDELILSTPEKDRIALLKKGFMANNYCWLSCLWNKSKGFWNNDVTISNILPLVSELGHWIQLYYKDLNVPVTTAKIDSTGIPGFEEFEYPVAFVTPVCIGVKGDSDGFFYTQEGKNGFQYRLYLNPQAANRVIFQDGKITFKQHFLGKLYGIYLTAPGTNIPSNQNITTQLQVSPFEPVVLLASRDYKPLGIVKGHEYVIPAFLAAVYQQSLDDNASWDKVRSAGNYVAIGAAVIAAPFTEGASWAAYTAVAAGIIAAADEVVKPGRLKLGSSDAYDKKYKAFYQAWDVLYSATMVVDALANAPQLVRSLRAISFAKSARRLSAAAERCGKQATVAALWEKGADKAVQLGKYSLASISKEKGFIDLLPGLLGKDFTIDDFRYMMLKSVNALTESEKATLARIRNAIPKPDANTLMQKVIPKDAIYDYLRENNPYTTIVGHVTIAADAKHLRTYDDLYYGLRLDYLNDGGKLMNFVEDGSCGVIRFKTASASEFVIPGKELLGSNGYPYTAHGFTSGNNGRLGVPEWHVGKGKYAIIEDGAELWEVYSNGQEVLKAVFMNNKFHTINR